MNKKLTATLVVAAIIVVGIIGYLMYTMQKQKEESAQMLELAEMDKREMENEYEQFAMQYNEMKMQINNDSLVAQLERAAANRGVAGGAEARKEQRCSRDYATEEGTGNTAQSTAELRTSDRLPEPPKRGTDSGEY